jgi:hypothetical protein
MLNIKLAQAPRWRNLRPMDSFMVDLPDAFPGRGTPSVAVLINTRHERS